MKEMGFQGSLPSHRQEHKVPASQTLIAGCLVGTVVSRSLEASQTIGCAACLAFRFILFITLLG